MCQELGSSARDNLNINREVQKMEVSRLFPIGTVVTLKGGGKRIMIIGIKQINSETNTEYDYIAVPYPEGNIGGDKYVLFNQSDIDELFFIGYNDIERQNFLDKLEEHYHKNDKDDKAE